MKIELNWIAPFSSKIHGTQGLSILDFWDFMDLDLGLFGWGGREGGMEGGRGLRR